MKLLIIIMIWAMSFDMDDSQKNLIKLKNLLIEMKNLYVITLFSC